MTSPTTVCGVDYDALLTSASSSSPSSVLQAVVDGMDTAGLQATQLGRARRVVQRLLARRRHEQQQQTRPPRAHTDTLFLCYTSNLISSGLRDTFAYLAQHRLVDAIVTTAGGVEEDVIKCLGATVLGDFTLDGATLRRRGLNRVGNVLVPNDNYCRFEDFLMPVLADVHAAQRATSWRAGAGDTTSPSSLIRRMGERLARDDVTTAAARASSVVYWCYVNDIPIFSPALTDGSIGDMIYFYNFGKKGLVVDPVPDVLALRALRRGVCVGDNSAAAARCAALVLGGGLPRHHLLCNVPMHTVVSLTTGLEADGCVSSCSIADDGACGLLHRDTEVVRVHGDAALLFPLLLLHESPASSTTTTTTTASAALDNERATKETCA